jgi:putative tricarboxylic transport membrane protein
VDRGDVLSALVWLLLGAGVARAGLDLGLGVLHDPGPGFMLFWVGLVMAALAVAVGVRGLRAGAPPGARWAGVRWTKLVGVTAALAAYGWLLPQLGFLLTTALLLIYLFKAIEPQRWSVAVAGAVASALVAYLVFKVWLGAQLPAGPLGIG